MGDGTRRTLKLGAFAAIFSLFHFAYGWWPSAFTAVFSGIDESVFQHMKTGYFAWLAASALEWLLSRPPRGNRLSFAAVRLWCAFLVVYLFVSLWYLGPAFAGPMPSDAAELALAFSSVALGGLAALSLEAQLEKAPLSRGFELGALAATLLALCLFARFTAAKPWIDLFEIPPLP